MPTKVLDPLPGSRLKDKVAIVTGAGQGIGRATARRLAQEGASIFVVDLHAEGANRTVAELQEAGVKASAFLGDLRQVETARAMVDEAIRVMGQVDILVNNVGGAMKLKPFWLQSVEEIVAEINVTAWPTIWCTYAVLPHMTERRRGRIVNVGSSSAAFGQWDRAPYNFAKGGIHAFTVAIAREVAEYGITCNCVAPGGTQTNADRLIDRRGQPGNQMFVGMTAEEKHYLEVNAERGKHHVPMGRSGRPEEQAAAIAFLASDDASYVTGQVLSVNGGSMTSLH